MIAPRRKAALLGPALAALAALLPAPAARAQWRNPYTGTAWNNPASSLLDTMIRNRALRDALERRPAKARAGAPPEAERTTYRPGPSRAAEEFAAALFESPADRAELAGYLAQVLESWRGDARAAGRENDVSFALATFIAGNWAVFAQADVSDEAIAAVARQLDAPLAGMPGLQQAADARRQAFAEHLICSTALVLGGYSQGLQKKDAAQQQTFRALAGSMLEKVAGVEAARLQVGGAGMSLKPAGAR